MAKTAETGTTCLFERTLSMTGSAVLTKRAEDIAARARRKQEDKIRQREEELQDIDDEISSWEDLSVKTTVDLNPGGKFEAAIWVEKIDELSIKREVIERKLKIARDNYTKYFAGTPEA